MHLITLGCSWTQQYDSSIKPWPEIISEKTGWNLINYGLNGSGNKYALDRFLDHIRKGLPVDKVYWLLTEYDRLDISTHNSFNNLTFKIINHGLNLNFLERAQKRFLELHPDATEAQINLMINNNDKIKKICEIMANNLDYQHIIDTTFYYIFLMQSICEQYNIELKIAQGIPPINYYIAETSPQIIASNILKSKFAKKLNSNNFIGYPFYPVAGGKSIINISNWNKKYSISDNDNHPNQLASNLIADIFLNKVDLLKIN